MLTIDHWEVVHSDDWSILEDWLADSSLSREICQALCLEAARHDAGNCLLLLIKSGVVDQATLQRSLFAAINRRCYTAMHLLLQNGCDSNYLYRIGTPLHCALKCELSYGLQLEDLTGKVLRHVTQGIEVLLQYNPNPTIVVNDKTPRELALELHQFAAAELLASYEQRYDAAADTTE